MTDESSEIVICRGPIKGCDGTRDPATCPDCYRHEVDPRRSPDETMAAIDAALARGDA